MFLSQVELEKCFVFLRNDLQSKKLFLTKIFATNSTKFAATNSNNKFVQNANYFECTKKSFFRMQNNNVKIHLKKSLFNIPIGTVLTSDRISEYQLNFI